MEIRLRYELMKIRVKYGRMLCVLGCVSELRFAIPFHILTLVKNK